MRLTNRFIATITVTIIIIASQGMGKVPQLINYQGRLTDSVGTPFPDGNYSVTFRIYNDSISGSTLWQEGQLVTVKNGLYHLLLGSIVSLPDTLFNEQNRWLGVQIGLDAEMAPRLRLTSVPYALRAERSEYQSGILEKPLWGQYVVDTTGAITLIDSIEFRPPFPGWILVTATGLCEITGAMDDRTELHLGMNLFRGTVTRRTVIKVPTLGSSASWILPFRDELGPIPSPTVLMDSIFTYFLTAQLNGVATGMRVTLTNVRLQVHFFPNYYENN